MSPVGDSEFAALNSMLMDLAGKLGAVMDLMHNRCPSHPGISIARTAHRNILALIDAFEAPDGSLDDSVEEPLTRALSTKQMAARAGT